MTMALKGGSPGQAAAVLQSLVLKVLAGLCREPAFDVCSCKYKANKMKDLFNSNVVLSAPGPIAWAVHDPEFALVSFCLEAGSTAGQAQALGPLQAVGSEVLGAACCRVRAFQLSPVPPMCAGQPLNNQEGRWPWINLLYQKTASQESQQPTSAKAMLM